MKRLLSLFTLLCLAGVVVAQETEKKPEGYIFTDQKVIETTPVKNQNRSGTCWCFSTLSFLESEILREGGKAVHLSEMWIVRHTFMKKAEMYVRMHGTLNFAEGGAAHDVTEMIKEHGIVPFEVYKGASFVNIALKQCKPSFKCDTSINIAPPPAFVNSRLPVSSSNQ